MSKQKREKTLIAQRREELGLTQAEMAQRARVDNRTIQRWEEKGKPGPMPLWKTLAVCRAYQWTLEEMTRVCYPDKITAFAQAAERPGQYKTNGGTA